MLTREENELVTRTGPGTPMGAVMRRYWMPALLSWELPEPDCPPVRVKLLNEQLVAFRDTNGRLGMLEEFCAHRGVSLWLGRNEECGLRCVFHGWKYDVYGNCVDQMNEPQDFKDKIHLKAYPTVELGGVIWTYMGPPDKKPPLPKFEWTQAPESHRHVSKVIQECNWLQAFEGGVDTSHDAILHRALGSDTGGIGSTDPVVRGGAPSLEVEVTGYGYRYFGIRSLGDEGTDVQAYHYVMPFTQIRADRYVGKRIAGHYWAPIDDESCMVWNWEYSFSDEPLSDERRAEEIAGNGPAHVDQTTFLSFQNARNNWLIENGHGEMSVYWKHDLNLKDFEKKRVASKHAFENKLGIFSEGALS